MSGEPPPKVGAPAEYAAAEEMPGCVTAAVVFLASIPYFLFRELPTLPLDFGVLLYERFGWRAIVVYLIALILLVGAVCWFLMSQLI